MRGKKLLDDFVELIFKRRREGKTIATIGPELNKSFSTIQSILSRKTVNNRLGRPKKTSTKLDEQIILDVKLNRFATNETIARNFNVSREAIRRRCLESKMRSRLAVVD